MCFGFLRIKRLEKKKAKSAAFIASLPEQTDDFLKEAYIALDGMRQTGHTNPFTQTEIMAVEDELNKRGFEYQYDY